MTPFVGLRKMSRRPVCHRTARKGTDFEPSFTLEMASYGSRFNVLDSLYEPSVSGPVLSISHLPRSLIGTASPTMYEWELPTDKHG